MFNNLLKIVVLVLLTTTVISLLAVTDVIQLPIPQESQSQELPQPQVPKNYKPPVEQNLTVGQAFQFVQTVLYTKNPPPFTYEDFYWLRLNMYFEDRQNGLRSMQAIGLVTLNRVNNKYFDNSIREVVTEAVLENGTPVKHECQFSWYCNGRPDKPRLGHPAEYKAWMLAGEAARQVLTGEIEDFTQGALYYHADYVKPAWSKGMIRTAYVARHIFYTPAEG